MAIAPMWRRHKWHISPNSDAGLVLDAQCGKCPIGRDETELCPILFVQLTYNYDQCDVPKLGEAMNLLVDERGRCKMFPLLEKLGGKQQAIEWDEWKRSLGIAGE